MVIVEKLASLPFVFLVMRRLQGLIPEKDLIFVCVLGRRMKVVY